MPDLDDLLAGLTPKERAAVDVLDAQRLELERNRMGPSAAATLTAPIHGVFARLRMWDRLVRDMADHWAACDRYLVHEYLNMLAVRDGIEQNIERMPPRLRGKVENVVGELDGRFREMTEDDGGAELSRYSKKVAAGADLSWWWTRKPKVLPNGW
ncbi:hypothetical protein [Nocardia aurantia]|uniref:Uncharacterized protein n=1 Tax=Nocardia aurantia TaxID=2585199 RepID=A0A7K0DQ34_9NOCA|nr:hypothetical protein [Nocardia aurantia]MQY27482.1 hypothetical protein [Nocardia aurantia]